LLCSKLIIQMDDDDDSSSHSTWQFTTLNCYTFY